MSLSTSLNFWAFITTQKQIQLNPAICIEEHGITYHLCGIIYFGEFHFTTMIVDKNGQTQYNDEIVTGNTSTSEYPVSMAHHTLLNKAHSRFSFVAIYSKLCLT